MGSEPVGSPGRGAGRRGGHDVDRKLETKTIAAIVVAVVLIAFALANSQEVEVDFLVFQANTPLVVAIVIAMLLGFLLGNLLRRRTHKPR
jgi:uncharacterized integral membrane protein